MQESCVGCYQMFNVCNRSWKGERRRERGNKFERKMSENIPKPVKDNNIQIQEAM